MRSLYYFGIAGYYFALMVVKVIVHFPSLLHFVLVYRAVQRETERRNEEKRQAILAACR